jgi:hypothetical protein
MWMAHDTKMIIAHAKTKRTVNRLSGSGTLRHSPKNHRLGLLLGVERE